MTAPLCPSRVDVHCSLSEFQIMTTPSFDLGTIHFASRDQEIAKTRLSGPSRVVVHREVAGFQIFIVLSFDPGVGQLLL